MQHRDVPEWSSYVTEAAHNRVVELQKVQVGQELTCDLHIMAWGVDAKLDLVESGQLWGIEATEGQTQEFLVELKNVFNTFVLNHDFHELVLDRLKVDDFGIFELLIYSVKSLNFIFGGEHFRRGYIDFLLVNVDFYWLLCHAAFL